jgi:hypothetical protein
MRVAHVARTLAFAAPLLAAALAACGQRAPEQAEQAAPSPATSTAAPAADRSPAAVPPPQPSGTPITDLVALAGEYRVAGAGGREIDLPHAITARIDDTGVLVDSGCVQLSWVWFFEDSRLVTEQLFPRASCGRMLLPEEEAIVTAMNGAVAVERTPANGIEIRGENGSVLLFGQ